jgi:hypothetical protein
MGSFPAMPIRKREFPARILCFEPKSKPINSLFLRFAPLVLAQTVILKTNSNQRTGILPSSGDKGERFERCLTKRDTGRCVQSSHRRVGPQVFANSNALPLHHATSILRKMRHIQLTAVVSKFSLTAFGLLPAV